MEIWIDAQLSPALALWINETYNQVSACSVRQLGLRDAEDITIFQQAKARKAVIMSKDADFIKLLEKYGPPPQIIWVTAGNTTNASMRQILSHYFPMLLEMLLRGEALVEIGG